MEIIYYKLSPYSHTFNVISIYSTAHSISQLSYFFYNILIIRFLPDSSILSSTGLPRVCIMHKNEQVVTDTVDGEMVGEMYTGEDK